MMRSRLLAIVLLLVLILVGGYTAWWFHLADRLASRVDGWIADGKPAGITVQPGAVSRAGFPFQVALRFDKPVIAHEDPAVRWTWRSDALTVAVSPFRPGRVTLASVGTSEVALSRAPLPAAGMAAVNGAIAWQAAQTVLDCDDGHVRALRSVLRDVTLRDNDDKGRHVGFGTLILERGDAPARAGRAEVSVALRGENIRNFGMAPGAGDEPVTLFAMAGTMTKPAPKPDWRAALGQWRDGGGTLDLASVRMVWGPVRVSGSGTLSLDEAMRPIGAFAIRINGYNWMLDQMVAQHLINTSTAELARAALQGLMEEKGNADGVPLPLRMQAGKSWLGPQAIGTVKPVL